MVPVINIDDPVLVLKQARNQLHPAIGADMVENFAVSDPPAAGIGAVAYQDLVAVVGDWGELGSIRENKDQGHQYGFFLSRAI